MAHNTYPKAHVLNPTCQDYVCIYYNNVLHACTGAKWLCPHPPVSPPCIVVGVGGGGGVVTKTRT